MIKDQQKKVIDYDQRRVELNEKLRENYFIFQDFLKKGNIKIRKVKTKTGKLQYDFDFSSQNYHYNSKDHIFFEEPDFQNEFINQITQSLMQDIKPNLKTSLFSDQQSKRVQSLMSLKNDPDSTKIKIVSYFKRRIAQLDMKKKKTIVRYSNFIRGPSSNTKCDRYLLSRVNLIDQEIIHLQRRIERLQQDDGFTESLTNFKQRPIAVNEKGSQIYRSLDDDEMCFSNIAREDFEVFMRAKLFENRSKRNMWKFYYQTKWVHYTNRFEIVEEVSNQLNQKRILNQAEWTAYYDKLYDFFERKIIEKFPISQNEMKQVIQKLFEQMRFVNKEQQEYQNLFLRYDLLPLWPSTIIEQNTLLQKACDLFVKGVTVKSTELQTLIFKMNIIMGVIYENQLEICSYESKESVFNDQADNSDPKKANISKSNREKISQIEEGSLKQQIKELLIKKKTIILVEADWVNLLDFTPKYDECQINVMNNLNLPNITEDSTTKLLISFLGNRDYDSIKKFISEQTKEIISSFDEKFFLFIENLKYVDKTHNSISFELLVDTYQEGLTDQKKPFDTLKSKKLEVKEKLKKEHLYAIIDIVNEQKPVESALDTIYGLMFLKTSENRRKILNTLNAIRSIERRITYDLVKIFDCSFPRELDDEFLVNVNQEKQEESQNEKFNPQPKVNKQNDPQKTRRKQMQSFSEAKKNFDERYLNSLDSNMSLGRFDQIVYDNQTIFDEYENTTVPEIYVKGDHKDGLSGYGKYIVYDVSEKDTQKVEKRILKTISFYIEKFEKVNRVKDFFTIFDRFTISNDIFDLESQYQFAKLRLMEQYMQVFEQINDPLESYHLAETVMNLIHEIPHIDFKSNTFKDSYQANIKRIKSLTKLLKSMYIYQVQKESEEVSLFHKRYQKIASTNHQNFFVYSEQNQGGQSLSKQANQLQNLAFMERRQQQQQRKTIALQRHETTIDDKKSENSIKQESKFAKSKTNELDQSVRLKEPVDIWNNPQDIYDDFCLEKDMEDVFANMMTIDQNKNQTTSPNKQFDSNSKQSSENQNINQNKSESIIINKKFEGGPHYIYNNAHLPKIQFSPSSENENFINFFESCSVIAKIIGILPQIISDLQQNIPQKSILANQYMRFSLYENLNNRWNNFDFKEAKNIEDTIICDDENNMENVIQNTVRQLLDVITINNEEVNTGARQQNRPEDKLPDKDFLLCLDYNTLNSYLKTSKISNTHNYKELFISCNILEFISIRENLLHTLWERKVLSQLYKSQYSYFGVKVKKNCDINFPSPLDFSHNVGRVGGPSKLKKFLANQEFKKNTLSYFNEIDNSQERIYKFNEMKNIGLILMMDTIAEFQNIFLYEKLNLMTLENCVKLNQKRIDPIKSSELDLYFLLQKKVIQENPYIDISRIYLNHSNLNAISQSVKQYKQEVGSKMRDRYLFSPIEAKERIRQYLQIKFNECTQQISRESDAQRIDVNKQILIEKHIRCLKLYLLKVANTDLLVDLNKEWGRLECLHLCQNLKRYLNCIPNISSNVNINKSEDRYYDDFIYAGQKKKVASSSREDQDDNNQRSLQDENRIFIGKNNTINDILTIYSDNQILKKEFVNDLQSAKQEFAIKQVHSAIGIESMLQKMIVTPVQKQQLFQDYKKTEKIRDKIFYYLMKIQRSITGKLYPDYGRFQYINEDYCGINPLNKLYKQFLEFIQVHFLNIQMSLYKSELKIIQELLLFNQTFEDISPDNEMEYAIKCGRDVSKTLISYDEIQSAYLKENFIAAQQFKQGVQVKIVSNIIDGIVRKLQSFSNMEQSFKRLIMDLNQINSVIYPKKPPIANTQVLQKQVSLIAVNMNQIKIKEAKSEIKKLSDLLFRKLYMNLIDTFVSQCHSDTDTPFAQNFFRLNELLFLKKHKNSLNLNYFNTQFFLQNNAQNFFNFKNSDKNYIRIKKRIYKKTLNEPYLKLKLLITNLPVDFQKHIFTFQKNNQIKTGISEQIFSRISELYSQFNCKKLVKISDLPSVGFNSYTTNNSEYGNILMGLTEQERFSVAGKIRNFDNEIKPFKVYKNENTNQIEEELNYLSVIASNRILVQGLSIYKKSINYPIVSIQFSRNFNQERDQIDKKIQQVKNNMEEYQKKNFQILNSKLLEPFSIQLLQENQDFDRTYKLLLNICLEKTFLVEEIQLNIIEDSIKCLETEFSVLNLKSNVNDAVQRLERQKTTQSSAIRTQTSFYKVQANPCFSSPLYVDQKQIIIPIVTKVSYVQSFINRLRNKVSRVDLLSSGFGFVISVNDLEDCIQYLNKAIQQFGEKEIKKRIDSAQYLYDLQNSKIKSQQKHIDALKQQIKLIKTLQNKHIDALVHERGNNLIYEMAKMQRKQADFQRFLTNIESEVTQEVRKEMNSDILKLENDKQILRNQFTEFKRLLTVTFTHEIKTAGRELESNITKKTIDVLNQLNKLQQAIFDEQIPTSPKKSILNSGVRSPSILSSPKDQSDSSHPYNARHSMNFIYPSSFSSYNPQRHLEIQKNSSYNVQKCGPDEDILTDPVITTKYINKIRIFYLIKMTSIKEKYEQIINQQQLELNNFKSLHQELIENKKEENIIKKELVNVHNALKEQEKQNKNLSTELEILTFEKLKIEKNRDDLLKKVKQLEDQIKHIDKYDGLGEDFQAMLNERDEKIQKLKDKEKIMQKTVNTLNQSNKKQLKSLEEKIKNELNIKSIMLTKIDSTHSSGFPNINYLPQFPESMWQNKCVDLHSQNQDLEYENQQLIGLLKIFQNEVQDSPNLILNQIMLNLHEKIKLILNQKNEIKQLKTSKVNKNDIDQQLDIILSSMKKMRAEKQISLDLLSSSDIKAKTKIIGANVSPFNPNYSGSKRQVLTQPDEIDLTNKNKNMVKNMDISFLYQNKRAQSRNESPINMQNNSQIRVQSSNSKQIQLNNSANRNRIVSIAQKSVRQADSLNRTSYQ
ncbi:hypothetical protein ABPG72_002988 [Tetrahymena utriculariae]